MPLEFVTFHHVPKLDGFRLENVMLHYSSPPDAEINQNLVQRLNDAEYDLNSRSRIVRNQEWDSALAQLDTLNLGQFVFGFFCRDTMDSETALGIVDETEVLAGLLNRNHVHVTCGVGDIGADLAVDLDKALHKDGIGFTSVESILQSVGLEA